MLLQGRVVARPPVAYIVADSSNVNTPLSASNVAMTPSGSVN
jgi:hypothetical protein